MKARPPRHKPGKPNPTPPAAPIHGGSRPIPLRPATGKPRPPAHIDRDFKAWLQELL